MTRWHHPHLVRQAGFSLIEIIIVVALMAFVYSVAIPQFSLRTGSEVAGKLNQLAGDVRSAYDMSVLTGKPLRLVFVLATGDYWLEEPDRNDFYLGVDKLDRDATADEEKEEKLAFDGKFQEFVDLAGQVITDANGDKPINPTSPVVKAKDALRKPVWTQVENMEWARRTLGPNLLIPWLQAEHHGHKQEMSELGPEGRAMIYFFPRGYVERAVLHIAYKKDDMTPDDAQEPYTVTTKPYEGTSETVNGTVEVNVHEDPKE